MSVEIFYFSATGNSFIIAKDISEKLNGKLIAIPSLMNNERIEIISPVIGIVFPDYHSNMPYIIKRFISKLVLNENQYIFGICTYGGQAPGVTIKSLKNIIYNQGGFLSLGFSIKMPYNYILPYINFKKFKTGIKLNSPDNDVQQELFRKSKIKIEKICQLIMRQEKGIYENTAEILFSIIDFLNLKNTFGKNMWLKIAGFKGKAYCSFLESLNYMDNGFNTDEKCIGCGTCSKICPVNDIKMINYKPVWQHKCEQCFACLQWCPTEAIQFGGEKILGKRYHHPDVKVTDLFFH